MASSENSLRTGLALKLAQRLVITPQLQQAIKLLQLTRLELSQEVHQQMLENPLLDEMTDDMGAVDAEESLPQTSGEGDGESPDTPDDSDFTWQDEPSWDFDSGEDTPSFEAQPSYEQFIATPISHTEHLLWQLRLASITEAERRVGEALIGNINEDGYLIGSLSEVCETLQIPPALAESVLHIVQEFDPPGVGARNLKECLLIQVAQLHCSGSLIEDIVGKHLENMQRGEYQQIARACHATLSEVQQACTIISRLEPKPCRPFCVTDNPAVTPDVTVVPWEGKYVAVLNEEGLPKLRINAFYRNLMRAQGGQKSTRAYLKERFRSALWLVRSIEQRNQTIQRVAQSIVNFQSAFLEKGIGHLKPLVLKQIADNTAVHESTVSRVTTRKYMDTPQGIYEMKFFFNSGLPRAGETGESQCSSTVVREMIRSMVDREDVSHPLRDQEIVERLRKEKIEIARRTVSKYRVLLKIPPVHMRKVALR
jgi:RNA polymerase sigma-54 factor